MISIGIVVGIVLVVLAVTAVVTWFAATAYHKNVTEKEIGNAEDKAREIIDEALKAAETKKRETSLKLKEENIRSKNELDKEIKERRAEVQRY
ncbi:MAG: Rnase Y domain-containing protein, partial [Lachnospiraceae bacterium]|nr:Rnase Y domain-containing protein [Lachnospiraceae bacterium]